ncbi:hypothetical protein [Amycolatopsis sp. lyj-23]|uniref:hypothetical protein n=1 Tax=Amycolatopsis sp. lyj-23 TaxID=2789283 RepID=UPI00397B4728
MSEPREPKSQGTSWRKRAADSFREMICVDGARWVKREDATAEDIRQAQAYRRKIRDSQLPPHRRSATRRRDAKRHGMVPFECPTCGGIEFGIDRDRDGTSMELVCLESDCDFRGTWP